ncbi:MAG: hypothetical protein A3I44_01310 [Candidatus Sungbacteria bacterium RIFCSPLOWO2_02_FULL_51_17]|uniref:Peptidase S11 D-alanyl-D-alanine carboxypeptidase A N-terminal domain-containing protein n=1 Tax=Candidatus Sungbacteria bacterium RIFCSPHIGHO2_02_FULL_51_29 TaxID=1802273 RepID=A0A1G2KVS8_9BACT|nr:MAG: hypothetical protein A3C16_00540 [Candidatus Sungbacteria bacterium RIFCSPHIGHO2_02_FULL_51_29]OHA10758.1 MAG: hypothetical protein A3I44_01310 [Candidatus Sungbacteria bacterium RIFCSPLOWO2_02_FULL_51_17]
MSKEYWNIFFQLSALLTMLAAAALFQAVFYHAGISEKNTAAIAHRRMGEFIRVPDVSEPELSAESVLVSRLQTGQILLAKDQDRALAIGSLAKLLTAVVAEDLFDPLEELPLTAESKQAEEPGEKMSMIPAGESFKAEDMIKLLLIDSANDAGRSLADAIALKKDPLLNGVAPALRLEEATRALNARAKEFGLASSSFANSTGIDNPAGYSTARDLTLLARALYGSYPELWAVTRTIETTLFSKSGASYHITNTNSLLKEFPMIFGSKTGTTDAAGEALLLLYQVRINDPVVIVILRSRDRERDAKTIIHFIEAGFLLE